MVLVLLLQSQTEAQVDEAEFDYAEVQEENLDQSSGGGTLGLDDEKLESGEEELQDFRYFQVLSD